MYLASRLSPALISMADEISPTPKESKKKHRDIGKLVRDLIKRPNLPKSANDSARQSNSTRISASASGAHHGTDAGNAEPTASGKYIWLHLSVIDDGIQAAMLL
jgi:hypothetical protein